MSASYVDPGDRGGRGDARERPDSPADLRAQDRAAREAARTVFDRPVVLEAGAGTGKTTALVARVIAWLVEPGFERARAALGPAETADPRDEEERIAARALERVLAITFTEAAAAEMDARIRAALAAIESGATPRGLEDHAWKVTPTERASRGRALRIALDRPIAQTIHAWCKRLLAEHPLEAGLHPAFEVDADRRRVGEAVRDVVERALERALGARPDARWVLLANRGVGPDAIEEALVALAADGTRAEDFERDPFSPEKLAAIERDLAAALARFDADCGPALRRAAKGTPTAGKIAEKVAALRTALDRPPPASKAEASARSRASAAQVRNEDLKRLEEWSRAEFGTKETRDFGLDAALVQRRATELHRELARYVRFDAELTDAARSILAELLGALRARLIAAGVETFGDLLRDARALLANDAALCRRLRARLDQLLVDEFQDTDPIQCELVRALALDPASGPPIGLFIVGDPKQSIYGWRRADLAAYHDFVRGILGDAGEPHRLSVNYRSTQRILDEVERTIAPTMKFEAGLQPAFEALIAERSDEGPEVEAWIAWELDAEPKVRGATDAATASRIEGRMLARALSSSNARGVDWKEMAVLVRTSGALDVLLEELRALSIPYDVAGDKSYYRRREIVDAASLFGCVVDPADRLALLGLLRSPLVGVPDALLLPLWRSGFPERVNALVDADPVALERVKAAIRTAVAGLPEDVPGLERVRGFEHALLHAVECIAGLRRSFADDPHDVFVERLRTWFLVEATEASRYLGRYRLANLQRFFEDILRELDRSRGDARALLRFLRTSIEAAPAETEAKPRDSVESAVAVLTIHKAKGLDFREVFVVGMHRGDGGRGRARGVVVPHGAREYVLFGAPTPGWVDVEARTRSRENAERVRLLYVAMTRAKDRLVLSGKWADPKKQKDAESATTMMELFAPSIDQDALRWAAEFQRGGESTFSSGKRRCVLPPAILDAPPSARSAADTRAVGEFSADALGLAAAARAESILDRESSDLHARREAAIRRQDRPLNGAASAQRPDAYGEDDARDEDELVSAGPPRTIHRGYPAALAGTAIHRLLEHLDLEQDPRSTQQARRDDLGRHVDAALRATGADAAVDREPALALATELWDRFANGPIAEHLQRIAPSVVARELPILLASGGGSASTDPQDGALAFVSGAIDLVYRDPATGELVVVDYKTGAVPEDGDLAAQVAHHRPQIDAYRRALREALGLERLPRAELWFLAASRIEPVA